MGSFLKKVLSHELFEAVAQADGYSMRGLCAIVYYIHNEVPASCHGSQEIYHLWLEYQKLHRDGADEEIQEECADRLLEAHRKAMERRAGR